MSTSKTVVTCAEMRLDSVMCSAVFFRMGDMATISTRAPVGNEGAGAAGCGPPGAAAGDGTRAGAGVAGVAAAGAGSGAAAGLDDAHAGADADAGGGAAGEAASAGRPSRWPRMSCLVTRPAM